MSAVQLVRVSYQSNGSGPAKRNEQKKMGEKSVQKSKARKEPVREGRNCFIELSKRVDYLAL